MKKRFVIKKYREYQLIIKKRNYKKSDNFNIYYQKNDFGFSRVGLLVSKKNGNAVIRNKIKRQVRNIIDETLNYKEGIDFVIGISKKYDIDKFNENKIELIRLIGSIKGENNE